MESLNVSIVEKLYGERLDSSLFEWLNYASVCGTSSGDILNIDDWHGSQRVVNHRFKIIGWCYGSNLRVRPRIDSIALMVWDTVQEREVWCHVSRTLIIIFCVKMKFDKYLVFSNS